MKRLKILRQTKGISQQKLARDLNLTQATISKYESGAAEPDIKTIVMLSEYFGVSTDYLLENSDNKLAISNTDLIEDEVDIIHNYRSLTENQKQKVSAYLMGISEK